jgi:hypothetical protein
VTLTFVNLKIFLWRNSCVLNLVASKIICQKQSKFLRIVLLKKDTEKNPSITCKWFFVINIRALILHGSLQRAHLQVIHMTKITKEGHTVMGGLYINFILFVQLIVSY